MLDSYVTLAPRSWVPNPQITGGNLPPTSLLIPRSAWIENGRPQNIEEWLSSQYRCTCVTCPIHGGLQRHD